MRYRLLGRTGLRVSELCLGAMVFGDQRGGWGASEADSARMVAQYAEAGGNFVDTANIYASGGSERILGPLIAPDRERWVVATKYTASTDPSDPNAGGNHRKNMIQSLDASLKRLQTDYVDLYWVHMHDMFTPVEETVRALDDAVRAGKVLHVGISDTPAWLVSQAVMLADLRGWSRFAGLQVPYSLIERAVERDLLPMAKALELSVITWAPLGGGLLTGRYGTDRAQPDDTRLARKGGAAAERALSDQNLVIADVVNEIAVERGVSASQVAVAWVLAQQARGVIVPIIGVRTEAQLKDNLGALDVELETSDLARLDAVSRIELGFPHDFHAAGLAYGSTFKLVEGRS